MIHDHQFGFKLHVFHPYTSMATMDRLISIDIPKVTVSQSCCKSGREFTINR